MKAKESKKKDNLDLTTSFETRMENMDIKALSKFDFIGTVYVTSYSSIQYQYLCHPPATFIVFPHRRILYLALGVFQILKALIYWLSFISYKKKVQVRILEFG